MKVLFIAFCMGVSLPNAVAQPTVQPVAIGEEMPGGVKVEFIQYPAALLTMDGPELFILDFWNVWCGPCIEAMKELDSLQQYFGERIKIILVTSNTREEVEDCFRTGKRKKPSLPMIVADSLLKKYFPHQSVPHQVWLDRHGKLKYHTFGYNASKTTIQRELDGQGNDFIQKIELDDSALSGSILVKAPGIGSVFSTRSIARGGGRVSRIIDTLNRVIRFQVVNRPLLHFYQLAYGYENKGMASIQLTVKNRQPFVIPPNHEEWESWMNANLYCYDLNIPIADSSQIRNMLQQKLSQTFLYQASIRTDTILCLVAERVGRPQPAIQPERENRPTLASVMRAIERANMNQFPLINKIPDMEGLCPHPPSDFLFNDQLKEYLGQLGIRLSLQYQPAEHLVIEDRH